MHTTILLLLLSQQPSFTEAYCPELNEPIKETINSKFQKDFATLVDSVKHQGERLESVERIAGFAARAANKLGAGSPELLEAAKPPKDEWAITTPAAPIVYQQPVYQQPVYRQPIRQPVYQQPVYRPVQPARQPIRQATRSGFG